MIILTPTYNRAKLLPKLYDSLLTQTDKDFEWVIIDDGSTDNTKDVVEGIIHENKVDISYYYQENGGKARALNNGFSRCVGALALSVVDSDDYLLPEAVGTIRKYLNEYGDNLNVGAFFFHYNTPDGNILKPKGEVIKEDRIMTRYQYNNKYKSNDGCICYLQRSFKKYRYPEFNGEKYVGPTVIQMDMADEFKIVFSPKVIGVAEYQEGGLTKSGRSLRLRNPQGMIYYSSLMMDKKALLKTQIKYAISVWPYAMIAKKRFLYIVKYVKRPLLSVMSYIPGKILYLYWKLSHK